MLPKQLADRHHQTTHAVANVKPQPRPARACVWPFPSAGDADGDFWLDDAELAAGTDPHNPDSHPPFKLTINDGTHLSTSDVLRLTLPAGLTADSMVLIVYPDGVAVTSQFANVLAYTVTNTADGYYSVTLKLLKGSNGCSQVFLAGVELERQRPIIAFSLPATNVVTGRRRWTLRGTALQPATVLDEPQITVNGNFVNDHAHGQWWSGWHDLHPGPNLFVAVARNRAGMSATSTVTITYEPSFATLPPTLTVDAPQEFVIGKTTGGINLWGVVDDEDVRVEVVVTDDGEPEAVPVVQPAAVHGTNWWAAVPLPFRANNVVVAARRDNAPTVKRLLRIRRDPNIVLEITRPVPGTGADVEGAINNATFEVEGVASPNLGTAIILVCGTPARVTSGPTKLSFRGSQPFQTKGIGGDIGPVPISVTALRTGQPPVVCQ